MGLSLPPLLEGKRVAVLGSASGLGLAVAAAAEAAGAEVLGIDADKAFDHVVEFYRVDLTDAADKAVAALNGTELDGRTIKVDVAQAKQRSNGGGGGRGGYSSSW